MRTATPLLCLALALTPAFAAAQAMAPVPVAVDATVVQLTGTGSASAAPDLALLSAGVVTQHADAATALADNARRMQQVFAALRQAGVAERDLQTGSLSLSPQYRYGENQPPVLTGYQASNTVRVRLRELAAMGKVIDALARNGANQIDGPHFTIEARDALLRQARLAALADARAQAEAYAQALGLRVRRVLAVQEAGQAMPAPAMKAMGMVRAEMADTPVAAGENTVEASVSASFELGR